MNHCNLRNTMLGLAPLLLLGACSSADKAAPAATVQVETAERPQADEASAEAATSATASQAADAQAGSAVRAFVDPVTGQIREPTPAELRALEASGKSAAPSSAIKTRPRPQETVLPNGWVAVEVNADSEMKGCVQTDGRVVAAHDCKSEPAAAAKP